MKKHVNVYLYIDGFDENPVDLAVRLGITPDEVDTKGFMTPVRIIARRNLLKLVSKIPEETELEGHVLGLISRIANLDEFKKNLPNKGDIGIVTVIKIGKGEVSPRCAMSISNEVNAKLVDLGCFLDFDIYA